MESFKLKDKSVFVFDAFGTIFKTSPISLKLQNIIGNKSDLLLETWRRKQLEYSWLRNQMKAYAPFSRVTKEALEYAMNMVGVKDEKIFEILLPIYDLPELIDGAKELLSILKEENKKICILSNGTMTMLKNGVSKTGIELLIDKLFSVDEIEIYKPHPAVYQMALNKLEVSKEELVFFSSNQWDVSGASHFGFDSVWVNQYEETKEKLPFGSIKEVASLRQISKYLKI